MMNSSVSREGVSEYKSPENRKKKQAAFKMRSNPEGPVETEVEEIILSCAQSVLLKWQSVTRMKSSIFFQCFSKLFPALCTANMDSYFSFSYSYFSVTLSH